MDEKSQENSLIGEKSDQLMGFSWKKLVKILEEEKKKKIVLHSCKLYGIKMCREPVHFSANQSIEDGAAKPD